jgi:GT2 family glycosyltransferase
VDGASTDATKDVLASTAKLMGNRLRVIREERREGFVRAANMGFRAATGRNLTWLNDDARPLSGALDIAVQELDAADEGTGFVAMFHRWHSIRNIAYETTHRGRVYRLCHVRGTLYANFPIGRRDTFQRLGYFDERYYTRGADPDLSLKAWNAGLRIVPACGAMIDHDELEDERRAADSIPGEEDNRKLFEKWDLPPMNPLRNDFDAERPCTLRGLRPPMAAAA